MSVKLPTSAAVKLLRFTGGWIETDVVDVQLYPDGVKVMLGRLLKLEKTNCGGGQQHTFVSHLPLLTKIPIQLAPMYSID